MKKIWAVAALAVPAFGVEMVGNISEAGCGAKHGDGKGAACVEKCIANGAAMVLVVGDKVYKVSNPGKVGKDLYAQKVKVDGNVSGDSVTIASVAKAD